MLTCQLCGGCLRRVETSEPTWRDESVTVLFKCDVCGMEHRVCYLPDKDSLVPVLETTVVCEGR